MDKKIKLSSFCVQKTEENIKTKPHQLPLYATSSFTFDSIENAIDIFTGKETGHVYSRYGNPTTDAVAQKIADLEGFETGLDTYGFLTSSGMSAISTLMYGLLNSGDKILTQSNLYGGTTELFQKVLHRHGITPLFTNFSDLNVLEEKLKADQSIKMIYIETPANPTLACVDIKAIANIAKKHNVISVIDNTFCTPYLQQPLALGIDLVIHSTTKYLNGHGNSICGAIIGHNKEYKKALFTTLKLIGSTSNVWDAWLTSNGLRTLALRMDKHCENAMALAIALSNHPKVNLVNYAGLSTHPTHTIAVKQMKKFGGMLSFEINGGSSETIKVINRMKLASNAPTLGDVDTLVLHPATSSHLNIDAAVRKENGVTDGLIRMSVGIEDKEDIINDVMMALS